VLLGVGNGVGEAVAEGVAVGTIVGRLVGTAVAVGGMAVAVWVGSGVLRAIGSVGSAVGAGKPLQAIRTSEVSKHRIKRLDIDSTSFLLL
jgi:hypothetical protein